VEKFDVVHISTGDMLRAEVKAGSALGLKAKQFMDDGKLVPDDLIISMLTKRLDSDDVRTKGWLLDGFPRTEAQADALEKAGIVPDVVIQLDVDDKVLIERVVGRRTDPVTGRIYHMVYDAPTDKDVISRLVQRSDDTEEKAKVRLDAYYQHASALLNRYKALVTKINGMQDKGSVFKQVEAVIRKALDAKAQKSDSIGRPTQGSTKTLKMIIMGAPGCGKGTQCAKLVDQYNCVHLSTGDMLRAAVKAQSELGKQAKAFMDAGKLVPDELVISLIKERMGQQDVQERGWLLDGFPRTKAQADALEKNGIVPDVVVVIEVPDEILVERIVGRRSDPVTGKIYHMKFDPPTDEQVIARLVQRSDDSEEKVRPRLEAYKQYAEVLEQKYSKVLSRVNGDQPPNDVFIAIGRAVRYKTQPESAPMSVNEFVRKAEQAFETGYLSVEDTNWSGQAGLERTVAGGNSNYGDIVNRPVLATGDLLMFVVFVAIGRKFHGESEALPEVMTTAAPFMLGWFASTPLLGAYTSSATSSWSSMFATLLRCSAIGLPVGLATRGLMTSHVPDASMAAVTLVVCSVLLAGWRSTYLAINGTTPENTGNRKGGILDGFKMVTTLLRRW